jgi:choline dehydrogenase-like flavoprotein
MIVDASNIQENADFTTSVCVVGTGPAGLSLTSALVDAGVDCCLIEGGSFEPDPFMSDDLAADIVGFNYTPLDQCRARVFGGSGTLWKGFITPLNAIDFSVRPWVQFSGWPISGEELTSYYCRALELMRAGPYLFDHRAWDYLKLQRLFADSEVLEPQFWQFSPLLNFGKIFRAKLAKADKVRLFLNATVTEIVPEPSASVVDHVKVKNSVGATFHVRARQFVVACGAIENARLLLLSRSVRSEGLGNQYDMVGRFFMDHLHIRCATLKTCVRDRLIDSAAIRTRKRNVWFRPSFRISDAVQSREMLLNCALSIEFGSSAAQVREALKHFQKKQGSYAERLGLPDALETIIEHPLNSVQALYRYFIRGKSPLPPNDELILYARAEQVPNPESRVRISSKLDRWGQNRVELDWRLSEMDRRTVRIGTELMAGEMARCGLGQAVLEPALGEEAGDWEATLDTGFHQMGTTRMSNSPSCGVVDSQCRVHGVENLYIAGSSVFPTGGWANPTLTIVALALRLADRLQSVTRE